MSIVIAIQNVSLSPAGAYMTASLSGIAGGSSSVAIQIGTRPDFQFCVAPRYSFPVSSSVSIYYLNQATTYYARARSVFTSGAPEAWGPITTFRTDTYASPVTTPAAVMIQPAVLAVPRPVLSWAGDSEVAGYPASNLGRDAPVAWRSNGTVDSSFGGMAHHVIRANVGHGPIDTVAVLNTNLPENAQIYLEAAPTLAIINANTAPYNSGALTFRASANVSGRPGYHGLVRLPSPVSYPWWRVTLVGTTPTNLLHAEHMIFGHSRMSKNYSADMSETPIDLGMLNRTRSGNVDRTKGFRMRRVAFDLSFLTESQYETSYRDLGRLVGATDPLLVIPNSKAGAYLHDRLLYGALSASKHVNPTSPRWTTSLTVDSII